MEARDAPGRTPTPTLRPAAVDPSWLEDEWLLRLAAAGNKQQVAASALPVVESDQPGPTAAAASPQQGPSAAEAAVRKVVSSPTVNASGPVHSATNTAAVHLRFEQPSTPGPSTVWGRIKTVLLDYTHTAHLHGVAFIGNKSSCFAERALWGVAILVSGFTLLQMMWYQYEEYLQSPTVTTIDENNLATHSVPFPAITLCPVNRLRMSVLRKSIIHYVDRFDNGNQSSAQVAMALLNRTQFTDLLSGVFQVLTSYQYPKYQLMNAGLRLLASKLAFLDGLVISQIMMQGRMTCGDVLAHCYWRGVAFSCCDQFQLQLTEMGYCMSFNSRTSTGPKILCSEKNCHHVWSTGPGTGLELVFKMPNKSLLALEHPPFQKRFIDELRQRPDARPGFRPQNPHDAWESEDLFLMVNSWTYINNVYVMIHDREMLPDVNLAYLFRTTERVFSSMAVAYMGTVAARDLRSVPAKKRGCLFNGELPVQIARTYTQSECITECRVLRIAKTCGCAPYYIEASRGVFYNGIPECRFTQLPCLAGLNLQAINCSHCIPACNINNYEVRGFPSINVKVQDAYLGSTLEISYDMFRTAVLHRQKLSSTSMDLIVAFGGMASLCLGCSILTGLDILHMLLRVGRAVFGYKMKPMYFTNGSRAEGNEKQRKDVITSISQLIT
ncbi:sodium channel protein Nach isoform X2 [Frankliniella occidentalis]|uniref:Sodium channel protein Nach isoform X2 n=1 Tax=Frankliniella occidentalis TaxID=133901 RepID=A0A6J1SWC3_FRAOC|nr:sodium channel protein Nach isoform X2 [Frankliniella occidentalis]